MFFYVFIECVAWNYWWTWCVLPIICNSKHFNFFVFCFNVSIKIFTTPFRLLNFQVTNSPPPSPRLIIPTPLLLGAQEQTNWNMQNFILMFTFSIFDLFCKFCLKINLAFWCSWLITQYFSHRDLKPVAFLFLLKRLYLWTCYDCSVNVLHLCVFHFFPIIFFKIYLAVKFVIFTSHKGKCHSSLKRSFSAFP